MAFNRHSPLKSPQPVMAGTVLVGHGKGREFCFSFSVATMNQIQLVLWGHSKYASRKFLQILTPHCHVLSQNKNKLTPTPRVSSQSFHFGSIEFYIDKGLIFRFFYTNRNTLEAINGPS